MQGSPRGRDLGCDAGRCGGGAGGQRERWRWETKQERRGRRALGRRWFVHLIFRDRLRCRFLYPNGFDINWMDGNRAGRVRFDPSIRSLVVF
jgi:hypothetical protein